MKSGFYLRAHNFVVGVGFTLSTRHAKLKVTKEPKTVSPDSEEHPDLHYMLANTLFDVGLTSADQVQLSAILTIRTPFVAAANMASRKEKKYQELVTTADPSATFSPAIFETTGARHKSANRWILLILDSLPPRTHDFFPHANWACASTPTFVHQLFSVAVIRGFLLLVS